MKNSFYIGIEDLAANAMIEMLKKGGRRFLTYREIEMYGAKAVQILKENGEKAVLMLSRKLQMRFIEAARNFLKRTNKTEKGALS